MCKIIINNNPERKRERKYLYVQKAIFGVKEGSNFVKVFYPTERNQKNKNEKNKLQSEILHA